MSAPNEAPGEISQDRLKSIIARVENREAAKSEVAEDIKQIYAEAKGTGFDVKIIRKIVALRKKGAEARREEAELLALYAAAVGLEV